MSILRKIDNEKASVRVAVRVRPLNDRENNTKSIINVDDTTLKLRDPSTNKKKIFNYDLVYDESATQEDLHRDIGSYLIDNAYGGYNTCLFAYGQTGCFAKGTKIMHITGRYLNVEDVQVGDYLMGDDGTKRKVLELFRGRQNMYRIVPKDHRHTGYTVNADHILLFKQLCVAQDVNHQDVAHQDEPIHQKANQDDPIEMSAAEYYQMSDSARANITLYTTTVDFPEQLTVFTPHSFAKLVIEHPQPIPDAYKYNSVAYRRDFINGILTYGHQIQVTNAFMAEDIMFIARSLGLSASYTNQILTIGASHPYFHADIQYIGINNYYGFMLDGNHRFIGAGFNVLRNSGKTHSVMGNPEAPGLIPRVCEELFAKQETHTMPGVTINYKLEMSYLEIYSEEVRDLLSRTPTHGLRVREHPEFGPYVEGLSQVLVEDYLTIKKLIDQGNKERVTASTLMNQRSSRSHAILTLYFTQIVEDPSLGKPREIVSKINLVDLAGSERVEISGVTGINFKEAIVINKSLTSLGIVICKLAAKSTKSTKSIAKLDKSVKPIGKPVKTVGKPKEAPEHIPYRDSLLTWILCESLGGNSKTVMLANVSPSELNYNESLSTLRYAANAKQIVNSVKINEDPNDKIIRVLKDEIETLKRQLVFRGSDHTATSEDLKNLRDQISQREELMREKDKTWEQKLNESKLVSEQVQEQLHREYREKIRLVNEEQEKIRKELEDNQQKELLIKQQEMLRNQEELNQRQAVFEKDRIVGTAVSLQEYYEKKLSKLQEEYELKIKDKEAADNEKVVRDITELRSANLQLKEELSKNQRDLQEQSRRFVSDRLLLSKQIQQLHNKIHVLESDGNITGLQKEYAELNERIDRNKAELAELQIKHTALIKEVDAKKEDLVQLRTEYAELIEKFTADKFKYEALLVKKEKLHENIEELRSRMEVQLSKVTEENTNTSELVEFNKFLLDICDKLKK